MLLTSITSNARRARLRSIQGTSILIHSYVRDAEFVSTAQPKTRTRLDDTKKMGPKQRIDYVEHCVQHLQPELTGHSHRHRCVHLALLIGRAARRSGRLAG